MRAPPGAHAIPDRRRENGMFDWERFKYDPTNFRRRTLFDHMAILDRVMPQFLPRFLRRIHRTRRALFQSPGVIGMRVREHDRPGAHAFQFSQPIKTAIDHHVCTAIRNQQRRMPTATATRYSYSYGYSLQQQQRQHQLQRRLQRPRRQQQLQLLRLADSYGNVYANTNGYARPQRQHRHQHRRLRRQKTQLR